MVRMVLSRYTDSPPSDECTGKKIVTSERLYSVADVLTALENKGGSLQTEKSVRDAKRLNFDADGIIELVKDAVTSGKYRDSEWCLNKKGLAWLACDSYILKRSVYIEAAHKDMIFEYFIKFAIGKMGNIVLIVSCHDSY